MDGAAADRACRPRRVDAAVRSLALRTRSSRRRARSGTATRSRGSCDPARLGAVTAKSVAATVGGQPRAARCT